MIETPVEMMTCDWCGKVFPADANACVEASIEVMGPDNEGEEWKGNTSAVEDLQQMSPEQRQQVQAQMGLDDREMQQLLQTGHVDGLGAIVCLECQDAGGSETDMAD